jgi:hypothetical protein
MNPQEVAARYAREVPLPPEGLEIGYAAAYIHYKAFVYLSYGPAAYREADTLGRPPENWEDAKLEELRLGCEQLVAWRGFHPEMPLEGIGIGGFYRLLEVFHFELAQQAAMPGPDGMILDRMMMRHAIDGREVTLYNLVPNPLAPKPPGPPCPYCGQPLRTARAKQCRACGTDWHDPENVVKRKGTEGERG